MNNVIVCWYAYVDGLEGCAFESCLE